MPFKTLESNGGHHKIDYDIETYCYTNKDKPIEESNCPSAMSQHMDIPNECQNDDLPTHHNLKNYESNYHEKVGTKDQWYCNIDNVLGTLRVKVKIITKMN